MTKRAFQVCECVIKYARWTWLCEGRWRGMFDFVEYDHARPGNERLCRNKTLLGLAGLSSVLIKILLCHLPLVFQFSRGMIETNSYCTYQVLSLSLNDPLCMPDAPPIRQWNAGYKNGKLLPQECTSNESSQFAPFLSSARLAHRLNQT